MAIVAVCCVVVVVCCHVCVCVLGGVAWRLLNIAAAACVFCSLLCFVVRGVLVSAGVVCCCMLCVVLAFCALCAVCCSLSLCVVDC